MTHSSDVREIAGIAFGRSRKEILMAIRVYSDKAGDENSDRLITVGGHMADSDLCNHIDLFQLNAYYDSDGVTQLLVADHDRYSCHILTSRFIQDLGAISGFVLSMLPPTLVEKRKKRYDYKPKRKIK